MSTCWYYKNLFPVKTVASAISMRPGGTYRLAVSLTSMAHLDDDWNQIGPIYLPDTQLSGLHASLSSSEALHSIRTSVYSNAKSQNLSDSQPPYKPDKVTAAFVAYEDVSTQWCNEYGQILINRVRNLHKNNLPMTTKAPAVAIHWSSDSEKWFVLDLDLDEFGEPYKQCQAANHPDGPWCEACWCQLLIAARVYDEVIKNLFLSSGGADCDWIPMLWCFSGKRGLHLYMHPSLGWQNMDKVLREQVVSILKNKWQKWIDSDWAKQLTESTGKSWLVDHSASSPIDIGASTQVSSKMTRLPFSPHIGSTYVCTPIHWGKVELHSLPVTPAERAVRWRVQEEEEPELDQTLKLELIKMTGAVNTFESWLAAGSSLKCKK